MAVMIEADRGSYVASAALEPRRIVIPDTVAGKVKYPAAGAADLSFGVTVTRQPTAGKAVTIRYRKAPGTHILTAAVAIAVGDALYHAANGTVTNVPAGAKIGRALESASGANAEFEAELL